MGAPAPRDELDGDRATAGRRWAARAALGAALVPAVLLAAGGTLALLGRALAPVIGPDGPLADRDVAVAAALWVALPAPVAAGAWGWRRRRAPAAGPAATRRDDERPPARTSPWEAAVHVAVGLVAALVVVSPFAASPAADRWVGHWDAPYSAWLGWRVGEAMRAGTWLPTTVPDALWPAGIDLLVTDGLLPVQVTGLLNAVGLGPYRAYNLTLLLGVALSVWAGRRLGLALTDRRWVALLGGVAFATAPVVAAPVQAHVAFVWSFTLPLLVRRAVLDARRGTAHPALLGGLLVLAYLCSAYHLVFGALAYALVGLLWPGSALRAPRALGRVAAAGVAALVVLSPFVVARWRLDADERAAGGDEQVVRVDDALLLSSDALGALVPPEELALDLPRPDLSLGPAAFASVRIAYLGVVLLAGSGVGLLLGRRGAGALLGAGGVLWLLSLGPGLHWAGRYPVDGSTTGATSWLPYRLLLEVPGLGNLRAPHRVGYALGAVLAGAAVLGLDALAERLERPRARFAPRRRGRAVAGVGAVTAVGVGLSVLGPLPTSDLALTPAQRGALEVVAERGQPGEALVVVPFGCRFDDPRIVALQIVHRRPVLSCSTSRAATPWASGLGAWRASAGLRALWCGEPTVGQLFDGDRPEPLTAASLAELQEGLQVRFVVVDRGGVDASRCPWLPEGVALLEEVGELVGGDGAWTVIDLGPTPGAAPERTGTPLLR